MDPIKERLVILFCIDSDTLGVRCFWTVLIFGQGREGVGEVLCGDMQIFY